MKNLNLLFNKTYYRSIGDTEKFKSDCQMFNGEICKVKFDKSRDYAKQFLPDEDIQSFELVPTYPGMLIGTGYSHGTGESDDDINIGFSFDYVTGQPYIPGSSIKGLLRNVFKEQTEAAREIVQVCTGKELSADDFEKLEKEIFDSGDVFFDAVVSAGNPDGYIMGLDNITPHSEPTKNPIPLLLLKILPGVHFEFRFSLKDGVLTAKEKAKIFETMLTLFGAGAKTNVGYGQLVRVDEYSIPHVVQSTNTAVTNGNRMNYGRNRNNNRGYPQYNRNQQAAPTETTARPDKIQCPHCGGKTWIRNQDGTPRQTCSICREAVDFSRYL